ncbi:hypothetical protein R3W88_029363 [Solanum pinnatisectum]|uniref:F-box domain-containing protein n=1 Tax=Solanum pinnatisectum TaxID=50273 RepID=A0AAV9K5J7_9SOLN|nr:hypothetical protein R3W88_029363 [Solanum pinnatisectum]
MIIFSILPVKSLLRFKCVVKTWHCWISSPNFQLSNQRQDEGAIANVYYLTWNSKPSFLLINQQLTLEELNYPLSQDNETYIDSCMILGSCLGLILFNINENIYLWNSATQFCIKVLELNRLHDHCIKVLEINRLYDYCNIRGGLCFDSSTNMYKVFVIIASLEDKQWRELEFPYNIYSVSEGITLHGRLHYKVKVKN